MMTRWIQRTRAVSAAAGLLWAGTLAAAEPCGGLRLDGGTVKAGQPLPVKASLVSDDLVCAKAVGAALSARAQLRSVTLAAKVPIDRRSEGAQAIAAWAKVLVAAGVPEARISSIVPTLAPGGPLLLSIAFREPVARAVALVQSLTGKVQAGLDLVKLGPVAIGSQLVQGELLATDKAAAARLALADGSFVALHPDTAVKLGRVELTPELKRAVRLELIKGRLELVAEAKGPGSSFEVLTNTALAGVRGTKFRVRQLASGGTGVETVSGEVELRAVLGTRLAVIVRAGEAAEVDAAGNVSAPHPLLPRTALEAPLAGNVDRAVVLKWQPLAGAAGYRVELAADGEMATQLRVYAAASASLPLPGDLPAGHWFWRVSGVDKGEVVGMPSKTYSFTAP